MATRTIIRGASAQSLGLGYFRPTWPNIGGNTLHAAYLLGNNQKMLDSYDYSFHDRHLTLVGDVASIRGTGFATPDADKYYETPFTDTELLGAGTAGEWTYCGVARANMLADGTLFSAEHPADLSGFRALLSLSGTFSAHAYDSDGPAGSANPQIPASVDAGEFEFFAVTYANGLVRVSRKGNTAGWATASAVPDEGMIASGRAFRIGRRTPNTNTAGGISVAGCGFYNRVLTDAEVRDGVYAEIKAIIAEFHGISI